MGGSLFISGKTIHETHLAPIIPRRNRPVRADGPDAHRERSGDAGPDLAIYLLYSKTRYQIPKGLRAVPTLRSCRIILHTGLAQNPNPLNGNNKQHWR